MSFTGECTERPENVLLSKHVSTHDQKKTTARRLRTEVISNLMLFIKLTGGPFVQRQFLKFAEFLGF